MIAMDGSNNTVINIAMNGAITLCFTLTFLQPKFKAKRVVLSGAQLIGSFQSLEIAEK